MTRKKRETYTNLPPRNDPRYMEEYRSMHKERLSNLQKERYKKIKEENPNYYKEKYNPDNAKAWREKNRKTLLEKQWRSRGIEDIHYEKYLETIEKQGNVCRICKLTMKNPNADHDHKTGKFRAVLCNSCNQSLGIYEKKKELFEEYLKEMDERKL